MSIDPEVQSFVLQLGNMKRYTEKQVQLIQSKVTLQVLRGMILANPVDLGRMRAGWVVSVGEPSSWVPDESITDKSRGTGAEGRKRLVDGQTELRRLSAIPLGTPTYVVNNVEYSGWVNLRHPNKAGFVEAVVAMVEAQFATEDGESK